jgi:AraC-like DNA-binding protein
MDEKPLGSPQRPVASTRAVDGDPLSDVLDTIRLRGALFFLWEPGRPYGITVADGRHLSRHVAPGTDQVISYHIVTEGPCWAAVHGQQPMALDSGDILLLPQGDAYIISDSPRPPEAAAESASIDFFRSMAAGDIPPMVTDGGPGPGRSSLICGFLGCNRGPFDPLLSALPRMIRIPAPGGEQDPLSSLIDFALNESRQASGGERSMLMRLSELMFVEVLRRYMRQESPMQCGWLEGLRHPVVGRALGELHRDIAAPWTLKKLAASVGASRSTLAERFAQVVGMPPMHYLASWRMQVAADRLLDESVKVYRVASEVGYDSEAAFSRAFKRIVGHSPKAWRESNRARRATRREPDIARRRDRNFT